MTPLQWLTRLAAWPFMALIAVYRYAISPFLPPTCKYYPSCSEYAIESLRLHGVLRGGAYAAWRLLRCHPFSSGGYDRVPGTPNILAPAEPVIESAGKLPEDDTCGVTGGTPRGSPQ